MSKKRLITLILSIGIFLSLAATVFAAGQPRRYKENSTVKGTISQSFYQVNTVPAGKVGHINLYYKGYKIGGRLTVWTANTSNPSQSKRYATYDVNSTLYPSDTLDIFSESYNANI